jgi:N-acetylglucosaminyldiphosphoundecaprenol N-acetyl-beta-D-mannosaminyltransferase
MSELAKRVKVLDLWVDPIDMGQAVERIKGFLEEGQRPHSVFAVNPEKNFSAPRDPFLYAIFRSADLLIPDGISVVLATRLLHGLRFSRVAGVDLMHRICGMAAESGRTVFLFGSKEEVNRKAAAELTKLYPGLTIAGRSHGYVPEEEMSSLIARINASGAEILFLGLGSPKQEQWYAMHNDELRTVKVCQGIGGSLDTIAGIVKRAPEFWQRHYLEWFYRLVKDPKRIRRQRALPIFAFKVLGRKLVSILGSGGIRS